MAVTINGTTGIAGVDGSASTPSYQGTDTNTGIFFPAADTIAFGEGGVESARFNSSGNLQLVNSISVGNATPTTSGAGITFPATQSASTDANTLDDYEEGTFTPAITFTTPGTLSVSYTSRDARYTKIGRIVYVQIVIIVSAFTKGTASGTLRVSGLPFAGSSSNDQMFSWNIYDTPITTTAGVFPICAVSNAETDIRLFEQSNNNTTQASWPDPDAGSQYKILGCYQTS